MPSILASIARTLTRHWIRGLIGLLASLVVLGAIIGSQSGGASTDFSIPGTESQKAIDLLEERFPQAAGVESYVVFSTEDGKLTDPGQKAAIAKSLAEVKKLDGFASVDDPTAKGGALSEDGRIGLATVRFETDPIDIDKDAGEAFVEAAEAGEGGSVTVETRGDLATIASEQEAPVGELVGILIAIILLTVLFRSFAAMFATLFGALFGVVLSQIILAAASKPLGVPDFAVTIAVMLGLGAGIDYALLIFSRYREQVVAGDAPHDAMARANATAGVSVVAAGLIVMVAIAGLLAVGIPLMGKMGVGAAIAVAGVVVSSIVVLPIFAGMMKRWLYPKDPAHVAKSERFEAWGARLTRRPVLATVVGGLLLVLLAVPVLDLRLGQPDDGNQPESTTMRKAYDQLSSGFGPGFNGPLLLAIGAPGDGKLDQAALESLGQTIGKVDGVANVAPAVPNEEQTAAIMQVTPTTSPQDAKTSDLVQRLREDVVPEARGDLNVYVGGQTAAFEDFSDKISSRLPVFIAIVIGLSILLLMAVFRSIWVPLVSAVFNLLSIGAAYGVVVAVFQWGWGGSLIGVAEGIPIFSFLPLMMFAILFGLSMDYNVFLLSRIREAYFEGDSPPESVVHGMSRIAKVVLVAGLIMASVFLAFISGSDPIIKMFGVGLGAAILIDVLIVRMIVSPALMTLLGDRAWWIPKWLDRVLPNVSLEGGHEDRVERTSERVAA